METAVQVNKPHLNPPGYSASVWEAKSSKNKKKVSQRDDSQKEMISRLKVKKAWDLAFSPGKSLPMNGFMLYMSGNSIQIFSIMITVMLFFNSIQAVLSSVKGIRIGLI